MKYYLYLISALIFGSCRVSPAPSEAAKESLLTPATDFVFQYSIIDALLGGVYEGNLTIGELKKRGDFGIGTFNNLDGEMVVTDGKVFKVRYNGEVKEMSDSVKTPLTYVKFFNPDTTLTLQAEQLTYEGLKDQLGPVLNENNLYAVRIKGKFERVDARSVSPVSRPYPDLQSHIAAGGQTSFSFSDTEGTLIGFVSPQFTARANIPGYHLHYLDKTFSHGGHVFDFQTKEVVVEIDHAQGFTVELNTTPDFESVDLNKNREKELKKVEYKVK